MSFGIGFQVFKYQIGFYQKFGLSNLLQNNSDGEIINKTSYFSTVYYF